MLRIDSGCAGTLFDQTARRAIETATRRSRQVFFYWTCSDLIVAEPGSTLEGLRQQWSERQAAQQALSQRFLLERKTGETSVDFIARGLELAVDQEAEVIITDMLGDAPARLCLHPWTPANVALLEWQARQAG